jgi:hypothetical protein
MKQVYIINYMEPLPSPVGKVWRSHQFAQVISGFNGYHVRYLTSWFDHFSKSYRQLPAARPGQLYSIHLLLASPYFSNKSILRPVSFLVFSFSLFVWSFFSSHSDVWIVSYPHSYAILSIVILKTLRPSTKIIVDIRDSPRLPPGGFGSRLYSLLEFILISRMFPKVDFFIGLGRYAYQYLPKSIQSLVASRYLFVPMPCEQFSFMNNNSDKIGRSDYVFLGTISSSFDLDDVISSFVRVSSSSKLHIIGDGELLGGLINKFGGSRSVVFHGFLQPPQIAAILARCRYGLLPYSKEADRFALHITNKFPEYLSAGIEPIVPAHCFEMAGFCTTHAVGLVYKTNRELDILFSVSSGCHSEPNSRALYALYEKYFSVHSLRISIQDLFNRLCLT